MLLLLALLVALAYSSSLEVYGSTSSLGPSLDNSGVPVQCWITSGAYRTVPMTEYSSLVYLFAGPHFLFVFIYCLFVLGVPHAASSSSFLSSQHNSASNPEASIQTAPTKTAAAQSIKHKRSKIEQAG